MLQIFLLVSYQINQGLPRVDLAHTIRRCCLIQVCGVYEDGVLNSLHCPHAEIQEIISSIGVTPTWDKTAAVKYFVWNDHQSVYYDDADTFKQVGLPVLHDLGMTAYVLFAEDRLCEWKITWGPHGAEYRSGQCSWHSISCRRPLAPV